MENQLETTLKDISEAVRERRRRKFGRRGESEGGSEESDSGDEGRGGGRGQSYIGMLGRRRVTPRWEDDPVGRQEG